VTINEFLHLMEILYEKDKIDFLIRGVQIGKMIKNAKKYNKIYPKQDKVEKSNDEKSSDDSEEVEETTKESDLLEG
jgi:hypothetical protein